MAKNIENMTHEERLKVGGEYKDNAGADGLIQLFNFFLYPLAFFSVLVGVLCIFLREENEVYLPIGIVALVLIPVFIVLIYLVKRLKKKREYVRKGKIDALMQEYDEDTLKICQQCYEDKLRGGSGEWLSPEERAIRASLDRVTAELNSAVERSVCRKMGLGSYSSSSNSSSDNTTRVKMKDGSELHTEDRFGDYKTYLYDKDGKNTGLHVQCDKVLDDNYNEVGSFDSSGKFNPKN